MERRRFDALRDLCGPDVVMHHPEGWPEPGPSEGREAVLRQWEQLRPGRVRRAKFNKKKPCGGVLGGLKKSVKKQVLNWDLVKD